MTIEIESQWKAVLVGELEKSYFSTLMENVEKAYEAHECYPPSSMIFNAFRLCSFDKMKVVIIGQDPYHEPEQAMGLSFSVKKGTVIPPSLRNIFKEITEDIGSPTPQDGDLTRWAKQGVLLLNSVLTVEKHVANSHRKLGWTQFTDAVIRLINDKCEGIVFMLWGNNAQKKAKFIDSDRHLILKAAHPSPLSANRGGWFGCHHFSLCNDYLRLKGKGEIVW